MKAIHILAGLCLGALATTALACEMPPLVAIPAKDKVGDQGAAIRDATKIYFDAMKAYTDCVQAELKAAGGDAAPKLTKTVLIARNNACRFGSGCRQEAVRDERRRPRRQRRAGLAIQPRPGRPKEDQKKK